MSIDLVRTDCVAYNAGMVLVRAILEELRKRRIVLPPVAVIERLCAEVGLGRQA